MESSAWRVGLAEAATGSGESMSEMSVEGVV